jgi:hypothetical protein
MISPSQRPLPDNTQHSQQTNIHDPGGIRTHNPCKRAAEELRIRLRHHWERQCKGNTTSPITGYEGTTGGRSIALLFLQPRPYMVMGGQRHAQADLQPLNRPGTHAIGGWVGAMVGLEVCGNSRLTGFRSPDGTALRGPPYRLSYPGPQYHGPSTHSLGVFKLHIQGFCTDFFSFWFACLLVLLRTIYIISCISRVICLFARSVRLFDGIWAVSGLITRVI